MNLLITGGTGFIGAAVVARLCKMDSFRTIYLLVRASSQDAGEKRVSDMLREILPPDLYESSQSRIKAVVGDLLDLNIVSNESAILDMKRDVTHILHIGASTDFSAPIDVSRAYNVEGTRKVLDLALTLKEHGVLRRFDYVSTAFVAGRTKGTVCEKTLSRGQEFSNSYEQSKYEAEILVRDYMTRLPVSIYRPSVVVGDSVTGYTPHFKVLYWPLRLLSKPVLPYCFINLGHLIDVVPCDFVSKAISHLITDESAIGKTFHLTAGLGNEVTMAKVLKDAYRYAGLPRKRAYPYWMKGIIEKTWLKKLVPDDFWELTRLAEPYEFYLRGIRVRFNNEETRIHLKKHNLKEPRWNDYSRQVLVFCRDSSWGRKLPKPKYTYYETMWGNI
jgi:thioester reductase-like protein